MKKLILFFLSCAVANGATYYISPGGNDSANGSLATPWKSIQAASSKVSAGDVVMFQPGIYTNMESVTARGTLLSPILLKANGAVTNKGQWNISGSNLIVDGFEVTGGGTFTSGPDPMLMYSGASNIVFQNTYFHDSPGGWDTAISVDAVSWADNITVTNCQFVNWGASDDAIVVARGVNWLVTDCLVSNTFGGDAFRAFGGNHIFRRNRVVDIGSAIIKVTGAGNEEFNGMYYYNSTLSAAWNVSATPTFVHTNSYGHIWVNSDSPATEGFTNKISLVNADRSKTYAAASTSISTSWTMYDPAIISPPTGGCGYVNHPDFMQVFGTTSISTNVLVEQNWVVGNTIGAIAQLSCESTNIPYRVSDYIFRNNVFINMRYASINIRSFWYNNIFYKCSDGTVNTLSFSIFNHTNTYNPQNAAFRGSARGSWAKNNMFIACAGGGATAGWYSIANYSGIPNDVITNCDYNYVVRDTTTWTPVRVDPQHDYPADSYYWWEPNGINGGNPKFVNVEQYDFRLRADSPLINKGFNVGTNYDHEGWVSPRHGAFDIGPFECDTNLLVNLTFDQGFENTNHIEDVSGYNHHAWRGNPTSWIARVTGPKGSAGRWYQVGTMNNAPPAVYPLSQYAYITNLSGIEFLTNGTISVWIQWGKYTNDYTGATRNATILDTGNTIQFSKPPSAFTNSWKLSYGPPSTLLPPVGPTFYRHTTSANLPDIMGQFTQSRDEATWYHTVMTWDATANTVVIYQDGVAKATNSFPVDYLRVAGRDPADPPFDAADTIPWMCIGASTHGGSLTWGDDRYPNDGYFIGRMDDLRIYNRPLSGTEIALLYSGKGYGSQIVTPPIDPPVIPVGGAEKIRLKGKLELKGKISFK